MTFRGLTWDHPRGYDALAAGAERVNAGRAAPLIHWDKQPLEGFESAPITELTARHDLVVLDHPHIGEAVGQGCLTPLEDIFPPEALQAWAAQTVGPAFESYAWGGRHWALPLDVATQVMARRPDRIADAPASWDAVEDIAARLPVALSLGGPHAFLSLLSMGAAEGARVQGDDMLPDAVALPALARLRRIAARVPEGSAALNPIALLEAMGRTDEIALVPLVFGYVTYARAGHAPYAVAFSDTIGIGRGAGGVLGGTGIAFSARAVPSDALKEHIASLMRPDVQATFIPRHGGQPSARAAWTDERVNADWGGFYRATLTTAECAALRPRFDGFPAFTNAASACLRRAFAAGEDEHATLTALRGLWRDARARAHGSLDDDRTGS
ncbi:carbohydrate ABC transporter substrate-binding protein [Halovulum sp. GXIMD14794]